jgi:hypothetical protein
MSTLQVANLHLESTGNNRIQYMGSNTVNIYAGGVVALSLTAGVPTLVKYSSNVGDASANTFTLTHNLNRADIVVAVRENSSGYFVYPDVKYVSTNSVIIEFATAPTSSQYYVSILGG